MTILPTLTRRLLDPASTTARLTEAMVELAELCSATTGFGLGDDAGDLTESALPSGRALSPSDAAHCLMDPVRTARFLRGVDAAVRAQHRLHPERPVDVVYAGTGPFAPLVLPLLGLYGPAELQVTLIDVHERSVELAGRVVERLGVGDRVRAVLAADATAYVHPIDTPLDIVVVEAMQRSLSAEPQVAIARQLAPQLDDDGVLIPERVTVRLAWAERSAIFGQTRAAWRDGLDASAIAVMVLSKETALAPLDGEGRYPPNIVTCPAGAESGQVPLLVTTIDIYDGHSLEPSESGLTVPEAVWQLADLRAGERVTARYQVGPRPGLIWDRLNGGDGSLSEADPG